MFDKLLSWAIIAYLLTFNQLHQTYINNIVYNPGLALIVQKYTILYPMSLCLFWIRRISLSKFCKMFLSLYGHDSHIDAQSGKHISNICKDISTESI